MEQQREQAALATPRDAVIGVSEQPAPAPVSPAASQPPAEQPDEQATLLGSLAPHIEPSAQRAADVNAAHGSGRPDRAPIAHQPDHQQAAPAVHVPAPQPQPAAVPPAPPEPAQSPYAPAQPAPQAQPMIPGGIAAAPYDATVQDFPPPAPAWHVSPGYQPPPALAMPPAAQGARGLRSPQPAGPVPALSHVPWRAAESWGTTSLTFDANTAAGASYLFWWVTGLLIYFNERHNRFVRFHAMQSILLTGALTVFGVLTGIASALCGDVAQYADDPLVRHLFGTLGWGIMVMALVTVLFVWVSAMIAAWTGNYLRFPIVGRYAERYSAPPIEPTQPPLFG